MARKQQLLYSQNGVLYYGNVVTRCISYEIKYLYMQRCKFGIFQPHTPSSCLCYHQHIGSNRNARHPRLHRNLYHVVALVVHPRRNYQSDANCMNLVMSIGIGLL